MSAVVAECRNGITDVDPVTYGAFVFKSKSFNVIYQREEIIIEI